MHDAVVVGSGPNGLAAAVTLARAGRSVLVLEAEGTIGGGTRSAELTLPGFVHDVCSAIHPLGVASPFFAGLPLGDHGLAWVHAPLAAAHPLLDGRAAVLDRSLDATVEGLGAVDGPTWRRLVGPMVDDWEEVCRTLLGPVLRVPPHPVVLTRFGLRALLPAAMSSRLLFRTEAGRALVVGLAAHAILDLRLPMTSAFTVTLGTAAHAVGWPAARGGSQRIADALASYLRSLGGEIVTGQRVASTADLPPARTVLYDLTPRQVLAICGDDLAPSYRARLARYRYGPGSFKIDYALDGPVPWTNDECRRAAALHVGGTAAEIVAAEADVARGRHPENPFVLCAQPSVFDPSRAPEGKHTFWAYCHVPAGSTVDMTDAIERQIERFAPGFRDRVLGRHVMAPADLEAHNANDVGGDVAGGSSGGLQLVARPVIARDPYRLPTARGRTGAAWMCSSSTPPGGGVHGMCGWWAAESALAYLR